jgi:hypothetical protein
MCELLEKAREVSGFKSHYEMAKHMGVSHELMSKWKLNKSKPNGEHSLILADMAGLSPKEALRLLQNGYSSVLLLGVTSLASIALLASVLLTQECILC